MSDRAVSQHRPTDANSLVERARGRGGAIPKRSLLRTFGPPALLLLCAVNLWWSRVGNWGVCLDGFRYSHADSITVTKGLFSHGGRLYFANSCKSGMYAGIRPKTAGPGEPAPDFAVQGPRAHGVPGLVNLFGIESPGLTASLALAAMVLEELG